MRDPRLMTAAEREAALADFREAADDLTVQSAHRYRMPPPMPVEATRGPSYTPPTPPPAELGFDVDKWNRMSRAERRAVLRFAKRSK